MTLLPLIKLAFQRSRAIYVERALYFKLSALEPHLLEDMGLRLENGKVTSLDTATPKTTAASQQGTLKSTQQETHYQDSFERTRG